MKNYQLKNEEENPQVTRYQFVVPEGHSENSRVDAYITQFVQNATRNKVQEAIKAGHVRVNQELVKASYRMQPGDVIDIELPKPPPPEAKAEDIPINIVFEDEYLLIVNKPAGMVVHPAFGNWTGTLVNGLLHHVDQLSDVDDEVIRPGIVHRLDKNTSGLLVVAKSDIVHAKLSELFSTHDIERKYHAIVWGLFPEQEGTITGNIGRSRNDRKKMAVVDDDSGKHAVTHYRVLDEMELLSYVELQLETGRTHQIRVHCSSLNHPVFGDVEYGGSTVRYGSNTGGRKDLFDKLFKRMKHQCLHAKTLGFVHPMTGEELFFESELPKEFQLVLDELRAYANR
ncbi:RluA family pseudouridine synthase [bacterium]|nr:MAG: RluA family pseudouridine synthase [bacterium]